MSDELLDIVDNIKQPSVWIRVLYMLVFGVASYLLLLPLIMILSIAQALFTLFSGAPNENLKYFSATLDLYISQIVKFLTYLSEEKPFPFSDFPELEDNSLEEAAVAKAANGAATDPVEVEADAEVAAASKKPAAKETPAKKVAKKSAKKAVKKTVKKAAKKEPKQETKKETDRETDKAENKTGQEADQAVAKKTPKKRTARKKVVTKTTVKDNSVEKSASEEGGDS